jgi:hypothetical protein
MKKNLIPLYFIITSVVVGFVFFISLYLQDMEKTVPKIKLSYFSNQAEFAKSIVSRLELELRDANQFWIGIEPQKPNHLELAEQLVKLLKSQNKITQLIIDQQLDLKENELAVFANIVPQLKIIPVRDAWFQLLDLYKKNELANSAVITASIYSTSMLPGNPLDKIKKEFKEFSPTSFSTGHFSLDTEDEKNNLFPCFTEDQTGANKWACAVINKARAQRRRIQPLLDVKNKKIIGLMDLTSENSYMVLMRER